MVIAPIRKNSVVLVEPKWCSMTELTAEAFICYVAAWINHEKCPAANEHQQGNGCLVDFCHTLNGYEEIADTEEDDNENS